MEPLLVLTLSHTGSSTPLVQDRDVEDFRIRVAPMQWDFPLLRKVLYAQDMRVDDYDSSFRSQRLKMQKLAHLNPDEYLAQTEVLAFAACDVTTRVTYLPSTLCQCGQA